MNPKYCLKFFPLEKVLVLNPRTKKKEPGIINDITISSYGTVYGVNLDRRNKDGRYLNSIYVGAEDLESLDK